MISLKWFSLVCSEVKIHSRELEKKTRKFAHARFLYKSNLNFFSTSFFRQMYPYVNRTRIMLRVAGARAVNFFLICLSRANLDLARGVLSHYQNIIY